MPAFYISGTIYCRRLLRRYGLQEATKRAAWMILLAGLAISGLAQAGVLTLWAIMLPFYLFIFAHGVMQSCGQSGSVAHFPHMAGTAAAFNGFLMMVFALSPVFGLVLIWMIRHSR
jgi:MFS transporter, DHA1 family, multidrug resistance protein